MEQQNKDKLQLLHIKLNENKLPVFKESKNDDWVLYGADGDWKNNYPGFLLQCLNRSTVHGAIIGAKVHYICGNGFDIDDDGLDTIGKAQLLDILGKANEYDETIADIATKIVYDRLTFGGCYIEILPNKTGKDFDYCHMPYEKLRLDKEGEGFWYSEDWSKKKQSEEETGLKYIPIYDPENPKQKSIMWFKRYSPGMKYYPLPEYIGAIPYIECDFEISNYHLNNIRSNFHIGTIINFNNGRPDDNTKEYIENTLKEKFSGTDNAGGVLVSFNTNKENAATVARLNASDLDKQFEQLKVSVEQSIMIAHKVVSPMLFGIKTEGQLGGRDEMAMSFEVFKTTWVAPEQKEINKIFNKILSLKGFKGRIKLKDVPPITEKLSEQALLQILEKPELRELAGYNPISEYKTPEPEKPVVSSVVHHFDNDHLKCAEFSEDELTKVMTIFKSYAKPKDSVEILTSKIVEDFAEAEKFEKQYFEEEDYLLPGEAPKKETPKIAPKISIKVMYSYEPRPGLKPIIPGTRDFCRELLNIDGLYSRADIDNISDKVGWNVWKHRGGFWRVKDTSYTRSYCRHVWKQHIVRIK